MNTEKYDYPIIPSKEKDEEEFEYEFAQEKSHRPLIIFGTVALALGVLIFLYLFFLKPGPAKRSAYPLPAIKSNQLVSSRVKDLKKECSQKIDKLIFSIDEFLKE